MVITCERGDEDSQGCNQSELRALDIITEIKVKTKKMIQKFMGVLVFKKQ